MTFDLYGQTRAAKSQEQQQVKSTLEALRTAGWIQLPDGRWRLIWDDHTDYGRDADPEDDAGYFVCTLDSDGPANWNYDYSHSHRGGPQEGNDLECDASYVEDAKAALREEMKRMVKDWQEGTNEFLRDWFDEEGEIFE